MLIHQSEVFWCPTHPQQVGCSSDAHAGDRLPLTPGEAAVAGALAGEGAE